MLFRKAALRDVDAIAASYDRTHTEEEAGRLHVGWQRGVYPERETALAAIDRDDLYVCELDGQVAAAAIINHLQLEEYRQGHWTVPADEKHVLVLHTLVVDPCFARRGCGSAFVRFYEEEALRRGCTALRMDTQEQNTPARQMYRKLGFTETDILEGVLFNGVPGVRLVLLEKRVGC